jgi:hypothetical protein
VMDEPLTGDHSHASPALRGLNETVALPVAGFVIGW